MAGSPNPEASIRFTLLFLDSNLLQPLVHSAERSSRTLTLTLVLLDIASAAARIDVWYLFGLQNYFDKDFINTILKMLRLRLS